MQKKDPLLASAMRGSRNLSRAFGKQKKQQGSLGRRIVAHEHQGQTGQVTRHTSSAVPSGFSKSSFYSSEKKQRRHVVPRRKKR